MPQSYETHTEKLKKKKRDAQGLRPAELANSRYLVRFDMCRLIYLLISILSAAFSDVLNNSRHHLAALPVSTNVV